MPRVSVIMPSYNHARYIGEAIESVLAQTMGDLELIVVDDGSSDNSREIIAGYKARDPRVVFLPFEQNRGAYTAINDAMKLAQGEYVAHLNSDDRFLPDKLAVQLAFMEANPQVGICFSAIEAIDEHGRPMPDSDYVGIFKPRQHDRRGWLRYLFAQNCLCHPTMLARRSVLEKAGPYDDRYRQQADLDLWIRIAMFSDIHVLERPTLQFRDHGLNTGGRSMASRNRNTQERRFLCERYTAIADTAELLAVFPGLAEVAPRPAPGSAAFLIALQALRVGQRQFSIFAIETLFRLLGDPQQRALLQSAYGFTPVTLHKIVGDTDCYSAPTPTQAQFGIIDANRKLQSVDSRYFINDAFDLRFPLPRGAGIAGYFLNMMTVPSVLAVETMAFLTEDRRALPVPSCDINARPPHPVDGLLYFPDYPAQFVIPAKRVPAEAAALHIRGRVTDGGPGALRRYFAREKAASAAASAAGH
jgi:glycosyltransferase involved in cell wall biosynthesis